MVMIINHRAFLCTFLFLLIGCVQKGHSVTLRSQNGVSVSIHGVNYTEDPFEYIVVDPNDASNIGGGEHVGPFSAGGIMCCFILPKKWNSRIKVNVQATHWVPDDKEAGQLHEVHKVYTVDVPPYASGEAGELWVMRTPDGGVEVVSSDLQPDHVQWPGKVKGWPIASKKYILARWELRRKDAEDSVDNYRALIAKLKSNATEQLQRSWEADKEYSSKEVAQFSGPADPRYARYVSERYQESLQDAEKNLADVMKEKP